MTPDDMRQLAASAKELTERVLVVRPERVNTLADALADAADRIEKLQAWRSEVRANVIHECLNAVDAVAAFPAAEQSMAALGSVKALLLARLKQESSQ